MVRERWVFTGLMLIGAGLAWQASEPPSQQARSGRVPLLFVDEDSWKEFRYESLDRKVRVHRQPQLQPFGGLEEGRGQNGSKVESPVWLTVERRLEDGRTESKTYPAGDKFAAWLQALQPLEAARTIGKVDQVGLRDYGLIGADNPALDRLSLSWSDQARRAFTLRVGLKAFGSENRFVQNVDTGEVALVDNIVFNHLYHADKHLRRTRAWQQGWKASRGLRVVKPAVGSAERRAMLFRPKLARGEKLTLGHWQAFLERSWQKDEQAQSWLDQWSKLQLVDVATHKQALELQEQPRILTIDSWAKDARVTDPFAQPAQTQHQNQNPKAIQAPDERVHLLKVSADSVAGYWLYSETHRFYARLPDDRAQTLYEGALSWLGSRDAF